MEAGLASGFRGKRNAALGLGATAAGVIIGHKVGEPAAQFMERYVGEGGIKFLPALAIGASTYWHQRRENNPSETRVGSLLKTVPVIATLAFAGFEGVEAGILNSSAGAEVLPSLLTTVGIAGAVAGSIELARNKFNAGRALLATRLAALGVGAYIASEGVREVFEEPKPLGFALAAAGTTATVAALKSMFNIKQKPGQSPGVQTYYKLESEQCQ